MASSHVTITDYAAALETQAIPGAFNESRTVWTFPEVVSTNSRGATLRWRVRVSARDSKGLPVAVAAAVLAPGAAAPPGVRGVVETESHQVSAKGVVGKTRAGGTPTVVARGKNLGKKNQTNPVTQALRDALSRYNAQAKRATPPKGPQVEKGPQVKGPQGEKGSSGEDSQETPSETGVAPPPTPPPMLVKKLGATKSATLGPAEFARGVTAQRKFNGVRLVAYGSGIPGDKGVALYSRTKSAYPGFAHIRDELACLLGAPPAVPGALVAGEGVSPLYVKAAPYLDGEIYLHGKPLQWISGQARKDSDESTLEYRVFDVFFPAAKAAGHDMPSRQRQAYLDHFFAEAARRGPECALTHVKRAANFPAKSLDELKALAAKFVKEGYEGAIARKDWAGYRYSLNNYHSDNVVKIKPLYDSEFEIVGYTQGVKGKDVGALIWTCRVDPEHVVDKSDVTFNVVPKDMSYEDRYRVFECLGLLVDNTPAAMAKGGPKQLTRFERDFRGAPLTVEYPERSSKTGKPVQAKALTVRTYEGGPQDDPLRRLYDECPKK